MANSLRDELEALIAIYDGESSQNEYFGFVIAERLQAILHSHPAAEGVVVPVALLKRLRDYTSDLSSDLDTTYNHWRVRTKVMAESIEQADAILAKAGA